MGKGGKVAAVEGILLDERPEALDQIQVGRVGGRTQQFDSPWFRVGDTAGAMWVASVVEHPSEGASKPEAAIVCNSAQNVS